MNKQDVTAARRHERAARAAMNAPYSERFADKIRRWAQQVQREEAARLMAANQRPPVAEAAVDPISDGEVLDVPDTDLEV